MRNRAFGFLASAVTTALFTSAGFAAENRQIEEVVVTAERKASSVQDTSISITAFTSEMLDDFGIRNQSDLQNMVPATTIQPYDSAVRGVGRNFRNLGGDPGVATYMNGVYSEDLYTATIGSFWDIERIEVLRGPQGTLYGRNAVGGAINFLYTKPSDEFEFSAKTVLGDFDTRDFYAYVSGPIIEDVLNARLTGSSREHDGWVEERGFGPDLDSGNEENIALQLEWFINQDMSVHVRTNQARVDRVMGGADGGGLIVLEGESPTSSLRDYTSESHGLRRVDPTSPANDFTSPTFNPLDSTFVNPLQEVLTYQNPSTGATILAQGVRPGVDPADTAFPNYGRDVTNNPAECVFTDRNDIEGDDLCAFTNGLNNEKFDQQGTQLEFTWDVSDAVTFKYIFGYNDLLYERITDDDSVASLTDDRQFYVNHEAEYVSHELQLFWDLGDDMTFTSGIFFYDAKIDQRGDYFSSTASPQFTDPTWAIDSILATVAPGAIPGDPALTFLAGVAPVNVETAREVALANGTADGVFTSVTGSWLGDASLGSVDHGPATVGTDLHYTTRTERDAFAAYTQGVWDINDVLTLTAGLRYARDEVYGEENLGRYSETTQILDAVGLSLGVANILRGAIDPATLQPTGLVEPWLGGVPITFGAHRHNERTDDDITWRINLDYELNDSSMIYGNVTTGYRSGGFNLVFFSQTPEYDPEELIAYELGYKGQFLGNTLQLNGSLFYYDYETIHTVTEEACPPGGTLLSAQSACAVVDSTSSVQAAPGARITGLEAEVLWLATDNFTFGGNFSYSNSKYTESFFVVDGADPTTPSAIYDATTNPQRAIDIKGNQLLQVPEIKSSLYGVYSFFLGDSGNVDLTATWSYIDEVYFSAFETELDRAPSYDRWDVRATWTSPSERWVVSGFVNNVFDEIGIRQILRQGYPEGYRRTAQVTEPRLYGIELSYTM